MYKTGLKSQLQIQKSTNKGDTTNSIIYFHPPNFIILFCKYYYHSIIIL